MGIKPISIFGTKRLVRYAIKFALEDGRKTVTLVHKGNIQKFTEGAFREWGYEVAVEEFRDAVVTERESWILGNKDANPKLTIEENAALIEPGLEFGNRGVPEELYAEVKSVLDSIWRDPRQRAVEEEDPDQRPHCRLDLPADRYPRRREYSVLATPNLNGDYISDACAAQVGGLGIAPGANIGDGYAVFEATHGTAPKYADKDVINPGSVILSGVMLLDFMGWKEAAKPIENSMEKTIEQKWVTYDFERQMEGATRSARASLPRGLSRTWRQGRSITITANAGQAIGDFDPRGIERRKMRKKVILLEQAMWALRRRIGLLRRNWPMLC